MLDPLNMGAPYASNKLRARQKSISARRSLTNQRRVMDHIHQFIRVKICVERSNSFQMLIDRHSKVEYVARQIEAEYTIRYLIRQNNQTAEATGISDLFDQSKAAVFEVSQIFDAVHFPIPFDGIIGAYVQFDDPIFVTDASDVPVDSDASKERLTNVLDNIMALQFFMEFCLQEYSVEPLLFYIEVEIFRVISDEKEAMMFAKYLYYTYVKLGAPISINLNMAVAEEIKWPITQPVSRDIYDEAQTHAYNILNGHSFVRYEKSKLHARFLKGKTADPYLFIQSRVDWNEDMLKPHMAGIRAILASLEKGDEDEAPQSEGDIQLIVPTAIKSVDRSDMMHSIFSRYLYIVSPTIGGYFDSDERADLKWKRKLLMKGDRLKKFFGNTVSATVLKEQNSGRYDDSDSSLEEPKSKAELTVDEDNNQSTSSNVRKKLGKIKGFFGESASPALIEQSATPSVVDPARALTQKEKRKANRKSEKLKALLGQSVPADIIRAAQPTLSLVEFDDDDDLVIADSNFDINLGETEDESVGRRNDNLRRKKLLQILGDDRRVGTVLNMQFLNKAASNIKDDDEDKVSLLQDLDKLKSVAACRQSSATDFGSKNDLSTVEKKSLFKKKKKLLILLGEGADESGFLDNLAQKHFQESRFSQITDNDDDSVNTIDRIVNSNVFEEPGDVQKSRRRKLSRVFGVQPEQILLSNPLPSIPAGSKQRVMNDEEKKKMVRRKEKLEGILGRGFPVDMLRIPDTEHFDDKELNDLDDEEILFVPEITIESAEDLKVLDNTKKARQVRRSRLSKILGENSKVKDVLNLQFLDQALVSVCNVPENTELVEDLNGLKELAIKREIAIKLFSSAEKMIVNKKLNKLVELLGDGVDREVVSSALKKDILDKKAKQIILEEELDSSGNDSDDSSHREPINGDQIDRIKKLSNLLGYRVAPEQVSSDVPLLYARVLTEAEKNRFKQQSEKLGEMLGRAVPAELINNYTTPNSAQNDDLSILLDDDEIDVASSSDADGNEEQREQNKQRRKKLRKLLGDDMRVGKVLNLHFLENLENRIDRDDKIHDSLLQDINSLKLMATQRMSILQSTRGDSIMATPNTLSTEERSLQTKRAKKLLVLLGSGLDEKTIQKTLKPNAVSIAASMDTLETDRRISTGTAESPEGGVSKPGQREKLEKLTQVLGFRIQESDLGQTAASSKRQLTANEKKLFTKKAEKLSAMLGTTIPLESIVRFKPIEDLGLKEDEEVVDEERLDASDEESSSKEKRARYKKLAKVLGDGRSEGISAKVTGNPQRSGTNKQPGI